MKIRLALLAITAALSTASVTAHAASMPNPPFITFRSGGTGVEAAITNDNIHPGNLGDGDATGGKSDLNSGI